MFVSKTGFTYFKNNKFEDSSLVDFTNEEIKSFKSYPSISPRSPLPPLLNNEGSPPFSILFHKRNELIKSLLWKTTSSSSKRISSKKKNLRKAILNCPPEEMLSLLKESGLLNDAEPLPSAMKLKPKLPSLPLKKESLK